MSDSQQSTTHQEITNHGCRVSLACALTHVNTFVCLFNLGFGPELCILKFNTQETVPYSPNTEECANVNITSLGSL